MRALCLMSAACVVVHVSGGAVLAHHSFAATYNYDKPVHLTGMVTKLEFRNPHIWVYFDVNGDHNTTVPWACEGGAPNQLFRRGWRPDTLKPGDRITLEGYVAKVKPTICSIGSLTLADGRAVFAWIEGTPGSRGREADR